MTLSNLSSINESISLTISKSFNFEIFDIL